MHYSGTDPESYITEYASVYEECRMQSRRCSRVTYPESYITKYTSIRRLFLLGNTSAMVDHVLPIPGYPGNMGPFWP